MINIQCVAKIEYEQPRNKRFLRYVIITRNNHLNYMRKGDYLDCLLPRRGVGYSFNFIIFIRYNLPNFNHLSILA